MIRVGNSDFVNDYIQPAVSSLVNLTYFVVIETVKIVVATIFLEFLSQRYLSHSPNVTPKEVYRTVILAPLLEEAFFRGILLRGIQLMQCGVNRCYGDDLNEEEDEKTQRQLDDRVQHAALIFAVAHFTNPHSDLAGAMVQFVWSYLGGLTYGYLSEKYSSLAPSILAHGFNNALATAGSIYPEWAPSLLLAIFCNKLAFYILATTSVDQPIISGVANAYASLSDRVVHWYQGDAPAAAIG